MPPEIQPAPTPTPEAEAANGGAPNASAPRRHWPRIIRRTLLLAFIAAGAWTGWRQHEFYEARRMAAFGLCEFTYSDPFTAISKDWRAAFRRETWTAPSQRSLRLCGAEQWNFAREHDLIARLRPRHLDLGWSGWNNVPYAPGYRSAIVPGEQLAKYTFLESLVCFNEEDLTNPDSLKALTGLKQLTLGYLPSVTPDVADRLHRALPNTAIVIYPVQR